MTVESEKMPILREWIKNSQRIVFFGGAGMSTESGIPDYRSERGIYSLQKRFGYPPEVLLSIQFFRERPEEFYRFYREQMLHPEAKPNPGHLALAELERKGQLECILTQNIDGLHQEAGNHRVVELHGSVWRNYCLDCGLNHGLDVVLETEGLPLCPACGGLIRPDVVLYGESLEEEVLQKSVKAMEKADLLMVGGTSLQVYPAAGLIDYYRGKYWVLINQTETPLDYRASLRFGDPVGRVLQEAVSDLA